MNYLGRPVFTWSIDWTDAVERSITYDPRQTLVGFGAEYFVPTQTFTAQGWTFTVQLLSDVDIAALDAFTAALSGRLNGFWLPVPFETMQIKAGVAANQFDIVSPGLLETWEDRPDFNLAFFVDGSNDFQTVAIQNIEDNGDGTQRVTLNADLNPAPVPGMIVRRLHYVRLAEDFEGATFEAEGWQQRTFNVVELPLEYNLAETGRQPVYLYRFWADAPVLTEWRFTSFAADVWSNGKKFLQFPITHSEIKRTSRADNDDLVIEAKPDPSHPFSLFFPAPFGALLNVEVSLCSLPTPDAVTSLFIGIVQSVQDAGGKYQGNCNSLLYLLNRKVPRMLIQPTCNYQLFDTPCGVRRADFGTVVIIHSINNNAATPTVALQMAYPALNPERPQTKDWYKLGSFGNGFGLAFEPRTILSSTWDDHNNLLVITLNLPLYHAQVGDWAYITAGCDGSVDACDKKFSNFDRFGGFRAVPQRNLTLEAFNNQPVSQGGKK